MEQHDERGEEEVVEGKGGLKGVERCGERRMGGLREGGGGWTAREAADEGDLWQPELGQETVDFWHRIPRAALHCMRPAV